jgi:hypothetical protein
MQSSKKVYSLLVLTLALILLGTIFSFISLGKNQAINSLDKTGSTTQRSESLQPTTNVEEDSLSYIRRRLQEEDLGLVAADPAFDPLAESPTGLAITITQLLTPAGPWRTVAIERIIRQAVRQKDAKFSGYSVSSQDDSGKVKLISFNGISLDEESKHKPLPPASTINDKELEDLLVKHLASEKWLVERITVSSSELTKPGQSLRVTVAVKDIASFNFRDALGIARMASEFGDQKGASLCGGPRKSDR